MITPAEHQRLLRLATRASLAVASILVLSKALAWWLSGSVSLLAGLTDSALDAVASFLNLLAVHYALRPADDDHRFGHGIIVDKRHRTHGAAHSQGGYELIARSPGAINGDPRQTIVTACERNMLSRRKPVAKKILAHG